MNETFAAPDLNQLRLNVEQDIDDTSFVLGNTVTELPYHRGCEEPWLRSAFESSRERGEDRAWGVGACHGQL